MNKFKILKKNEIWNFLKFQQNSYL
jgi:hypothetical protein